MVLGFGPWDSLELFIVHTDIIHEWLQSPSPVSWGRWACKTIEHHKLGLDVWLDLQVSYFQIYLNLMESEL